MAEGFTPDLNAADHAFQSFVDRIAKTAVVVALHDSDADGVTAGVSLSDAAA